MFPPEPLRVFPQGTTAFAGAAHAAGRPWLAVSRVERVSFMG